MSFFRKLLHRFRRVDNGKNPLPTRDLKLRYKLSPANGKLFAIQFATFIKQNMNIELDYSVKSLRFVDAFLLQFSNEGFTVNDFAEVIFTAGCYTGEVMVRNNKGKWTTPHAIGVPETGATDIIVQLPNGYVVDPIVKAFKRFSFGQGEEIVCFYSVFTGLN
ncbi:hypothetical protein [Deminuibacter soli]|uniref:Uncharacterized protein n=1 Tax=Deminuibacter soli TaxID=2291815 RepID=A0A3E1NGE6_9BACT|nr:hypothetical protein [Deminuibacter soli]RFM27036.1 hypothetical protein DXN05_16325 [Deminuibacter soli]